MALVDRALIDAVRAAKAEASEELGELARALKKALGPEVHYVKRGVYGVGKFVSLAAVVGDTSYRATLTGGRIVYSTGDAVGGIASQHHDVERAQWCDALQASLAAIATA